MHEIAQTMLIIIGLLACGASEILAGGLFKSCCPEADHMNCFFASG
jgi:hypothetical protein